MSYLSISSSSIALSESISDTKNLITSSTGGGETQNYTTTREIICKTESNLTNPSEINDTNDENITKSRKQSKRK